jgi:hypothetical protein
LQGFAAGSIPTAGAILKALILKGLGLFY